VERLIIILKMKKMKNILKMFVLLAFIYSCEDNADYDVDNLTATATTGGAIVAVNVNSDGKLLGAPSSSDLTTATVAFSNTSLELELILMSGGQDVAGYELVKSLNNGPEVVVSSTATLPLSLTYSTLDEYINGLGVTESDLRIGDVISFRTKMTKTDGSVSYAGPQDGNFNVTINCSADLSGTYMVTNDACMPTYITTITANADGTWYIDSGDGAFLHLCTGNSTLINWSEITVVCGNVLATDQVRFGGVSGNNIGNIGGGVWDGVNGVLTMSHTQTFTANWPGSWNSTYTRQ
jgi:hypothetical protein